MGNGSRKTAAWKVKGQRCGGGKMKERDLEWWILREMNGDGGPLGALSLSSRLGIPPASIGRALRKLEDQRLVSKSQNKGRILTAQGREILAREQKKKDTVSLAEELMDAALSGDEKILLDILKLRQLLECEAAGLCAQNAGPWETEWLERLQSDYESELRRGGNGSEQDLKLHLAIAACSGNRVLPGLLQLLLTDHNSYASFNEAARSRGLPDEKEHGALLEAIRQHDAGKEIGRASCRERV